MTDVEIRKEPIPYDEGNYTIQGIKISHNGKEVESQTIGIDRFGKDSHGRFWDVEVLPDGSEVIISVEVNTDQVTDESVDYENDRLKSKKVFSRWLNKNEFELTPDASNS